MSEYFPGPKSSGGRVKIDLDLSNYAVKVDLKNGTGANTSHLSKKTDLANLKSDVDKLDIVSNNLSNLKIKVDKLDDDKLVPVPVHLNKLNDLVKNDVVEKHLYNTKIKGIEDIYLILLT